MTNHENPAHAQAISELRAEVEALPRSKGRSQALAVLDVLHISDYLTVETECVTAVIGQRFLNFKVVALNPANGQLLRFSFRREVTS